MGADLIQVLVTPGSIVEALDVIEDFRLGLCPRLIYGAASYYDFE